MCSLAGYTPVNTLNTSKYSKCKQNNIYRTIKENGKGCKNVAMVLRIEIRENNWKSDYWKIRKFNT